MQDPRRMDCLNVNHWMGTAKQGREEQVSVDTKTAGACGSYSPTMTLELDEPVVVGLQERSEDRLLASRQADRQRLLRIVPCSPSAQSVSTPTASAIWRTR